jgi:hypothetical protein
VEKRREGTVVVSDTVRYRGVVYETKDFVDLFKKRVRELITETVATVGI